jgi:hypothetical protein
MCVFNYGYLCQITINVCLRVLVVVYEYFYDFVYASKLIGSDFHKRAKIKAEMTCKIAIG